MLAEIKTSLASYVAEKLKFEHTGSGVNADFSHALRVAHNMVYRFGMGDSGYLGNFYELYTPYHGFTLSEEMKRNLEEDVQKILNKCLKEVEEILSNEKELLEYFAQQLIQREELEYNEIVEIFKKFGKDRPPNSAF